MRFNAVLVLSVLIWAGTSAAQNPVLFNGGISQEERAEAPTEGVRLVFFATGGSYLSQVHVTITGPAGDVVVDTVTRGPWLILDLADGTYQVTAELRGEKRTGVFVADGSAQVVNFQFANAQ